MDTLAGLLEETRARGAFTLRNVMSPPWSLRILAESPITLIAVVAGEAWIAPDTGEPFRIGPGDIAVVRAPGHYNVAGAPDTVPRVIIHPDQCCRDPDGAPLHDTMTHGVRTWGNDPDGDTVFLVGAYEHPSGVGDRLMRALPPVLSIGREDWASPLVPLLHAEVVRDEPGQAAVLDRLLDLLLTAVLRTWFARHDDALPPWWRSQGDPVVERTLRLMHDDPARSWTMERLARASGASRTSLARRFHRAVGEPPMTYLKHWRLSVAADLLCRRGETVGTVAEKVGYASPFAFSAAFKRVRGISPRQHRTKALSST